MPSRNSKGQFTSDLSIPLPGFIGIYKILFFAALIFPWYVIVSKHNFIAWLFDYLVGTKEGPSCPKYEGQCQPSPESPNAPECQQCHGPGTRTPLS